MKFKVKARVIFSVSITRTGALQTGNNSHKRELQVPGGYSAFAEARVGGDSRAAGKRLFLKPVEKHFSILAINKTVPVSAG